MLKDATTLSVQARQALRALTNSQYVLPLLFARILLSRYPMLSRCSNAPLGGVSVPRAHRALLLQHVFPE